MSNRTDESSAGTMPGATAEMRDRAVGEEADEGLLVEAADWLVQLTSRTATEEDAEGLNAWRAISPAHEVAFRAVAGVRSYAFVASSTKKPVSRRAILSASSGGALALMIGLGIMQPPLGLWPSYAELTADHRTPIGGRLALRPTKGVDVELSSRTAISLINDGHGVKLITGESYVTVDRQSREFAIETDGLEVTTRKAEFNVLTIGRYERVTCVTGELRCLTAGQPMLLRANEALTVDTAGNARRNTVDAAKQSAWRRGLLIFEGTPLGEVVEQINLYRPGRIVLTNSSLGQVPLNGVFHTAQIENSVAQIEQLLNLRTRELAGGVVLLG